MALGFTAGWRGGLLDEILQMITNIVVMIPALVLLIVIGAYLKTLLLDIKLLVADEIISMLDASTRVDILNLLISLKQSGLAVLFVTHDLSLGNYVSDRTVILRHGAIVEMGDTVKVFGNPQHPYTRNLLTAVPELHKKWQPPVTGTGTYPAGTPGLELSPAPAPAGRTPRPARTGRAPWPATAFDPPPLTECEEDHLVAEHAA